MIKAIPEVTTSSVTVFDANGNACTILITLTPIRCFLTQSTKREILATGFLLRYGDDLATDRYVIDDVLGSIRRKVLRLRNGADR